MLIPKSNILRLIAGYYAAMAVLAWFGYVYMEDATPVKSMWLRFNNDTDDFYAGVLSFLAVSACVLLGFQLTSLWIKSEPRPADVNISFLANPLFIMLATITPIIIFIAGVGFEELFANQEYLIYSNRELRSAGGVMVILATFFIGYANSALKMPRIFQIYCYAVLTVYIILELSVSSRTACALPFFAALGLYLGEKRNDYKTAGTLIASVIAGFLFLFVPLKLRGMPQLGLNNLRTNINEILTEMTWEDYEYNIIDTVMNLTNGVSMVPATLRSYEPKAEHLIDAFDPRPGGMTGFYARDEELKLTPVAPYNSIGIILAFGWPAFCLYFMGFGTWVKLMDATMDNINHPAYKALQYSLMINAVVLSTQYTLRTVNRFVVYTAVVYIITRVILLKGVANRRA
jgi:hypothetical protein